MHPRHPPGEVFRACCTKANVGHAGKVMTLGAWEHLSFPGSAGGSVWGDGWLGLFALDCFPLPRISGRWMVQSIHTVFLFLCCQVVGVPIMYVIIIFVPFQVQSKDRLKKSCLRQCSDVLYQLLFSFVKITVFKTICFVYWLFLIQLLLSNYSIILRQALYLGQLCSCEYTVYRFIGY